jgi:metallophosphoesterase superfamily enzyme
MDFTGPNYPEHARMKSLRTEIDTVASFIDWMEDNGLTLCKWNSDKEDFYDVFTSR